MGSQRHTPLTPRRVGADRPPAVTADLHRQLAEVIRFPPLLPACRRAGMSGSWHYSVGRLNVSVSVRV